MLRLAAVGVAAEVGNHEMGAAAEAEDLTAGQFGQIGHRSAALWALYFERRNFHERLPSVAAS